MYKICLSPQLVPELIEAGATVYIKKERKKKKSNDHLQEYNTALHKNTTQRPCMARIWVVLYRVDLT